MGLQEREVSRLSTLCTPFVLHLQIQLWGVTRNNGQGFSSITNHWLDLHEVLSVPKAEKLFLFFTTMRNRCVLGYKKLGGGGRIAIYSQYVHFSYPVTHSYSISPIKCFVSLSQWLVFPYLKGWIAFEWHARWLSLCLFSHPIKQSVRVCWVST